MVTPLKLALGLAVATLVACGEAERVGEAQPESPTAEVADVSTPPAAAAALTALPPDVPDGVTLERIAEGEAIFLGDGLCYVCHGVDGAGERGVGADLTDDVWWHSDGSHPSIARQVASGVGADRVRNALGAAMPPLGGSDIDAEQVEAVAAYVWSLRLR